MLMKTLTLDDLKIADPSVFTPRTREIWHQLFGDDPLVDRYCFYINVHPLTRVRLDRLEHLLKVMQSVRADEVYLSCFWDPQFDEDNNECGSVGCVLGHAANDSQRRGEPGGLRIHDGIVHIEHSYSISNHRAGEHYYNLPFLFAERLFASRIEPIPALYRDNPDYCSEKEIAIARVEIMIDIVQRAHKYRALAENA